MFSKTNLMAYLSAALWAYFGGYLLWGVLGDPLLEDHLGTATGVMREMPDMFHLILGCIILAVCFTIIYSKWARGHHSLSEGMQFGVLMGVLAGFGAGLIDYSTSNIIAFSGYIINAFIYLVYYIVMGCIVSMVYKKFAK